MTGVPTFKLVNFDALLVTYPPNSFDFFISGKSLKYLVLRLKILKIFFDNFLFLNLSEFFKALNFKHRF